MYLLPNNRLPVVLTAIILSVFACKHEPSVDTEYNGYPKEVGSIFLPKCATAGCHNEKSKVAAAGLSLESWESLMKGGRNNAAAIAYTPGKSLIFLFTNTFEDLGPSVPPIMPYNAVPLSREEVLTIRNWIRSGARDAEGNIPFTGKPQREKLYVLNSLCDEVSVFDLDSRLIIRYVKAGTTGNEGFPESIRVAPDGDKWYVLFASGEFIAFDAETDLFSGKLDLGNGIWRSFDISEDSKKAYIADWSGNSDYYGGQIVTVDLSSMTIDHTVKLPKDSIYFPYGVELTPSANWLMASCYTGDFIYKIDYSDQKAPVVYRVPVDGIYPPTYTNSVYRPRTIKFIDQERIAILCEKSNEVRIMDFNTNVILSVISVGQLPQEIVVSENTPYMFVSCTEDPVFPAEGKGNIYVIDYERQKVVKTIYTGYQPKGLAIDDQRGLVYVANRNADPNGADTPHHFTDCNGNNGYVTIIDINSLELVKDYKAEVSADPFAAAVRVKK